MGLFCGLKTTAAGISFEHGNRVDREVFDLKLSKQMFGNRFDRGVPGQDVIEQDVIRHHLMQGHLQFAEIPDHPKVIQFAAAELGFDLVGVAMNIRALSSVTGNPVRGIKVLFDDKRVHE
jgi:hypothetical protein